MAQQLTPAYIANLLEADVPPDVLVATAALTNAPTVQSEEGVMDSIIKTFKTNKHLKSALIISGGVIALLLVGGTMYYVYSENKKKERARFLAAMAARNRRHQLQQQQQQDDGNGDNGTYQSETPPLTKTSGDDDTANQTAYEDRYKESTYAVL
jgi:hypothetical protein